MPSFSTAGGGVKATTFILPGKLSQFNNDGAGLGSRVGVVRYDYTSGAAADALNITGSGFLTYALFAATDAGSTNSRIIITIDGVEVLDDTRAGSSNSVGLIQVGSGLWALNGQAAASRGSIPFNKSLVINIECDSNAYYYYDYYLT